MILVLEERMLESSDNVLSTEFNSVSNYCSVRFDLCNLILTKEMSKSKGPKIEISQLLEIECR